MDSASGTTLFGPVIPVPPAVSPPVYGPTWLPRAVRRHLPPLLLMALAITIPEFLTGSTPVLTVFVNPFSLLFLLGLYGCGVLVIREVAVRWGKGWPSVLLLGGAYGIVEEGFGTKTFFMSPSSAAGNLATYGHLFGVSWVWVVDICVFHAIFSIGLPILLIGLIFPQTRGRAFVRDRAVVLLFLAYLVTAIAMFFLFNGNDTPPAPVLLFFAAAVFVLVGLAWWAPQALHLPPRPMGLRSPRSVGLIAGLFVWLTFGMYWFFPAVVPVPAVVTVATGIWAALTGLLVVREIESAIPALRLALAAGLLSFLLVFSVGAEIVGDTLAFLATAATLALLLWLRRQTRAVPTTPPPGAMWGAG